MGEQFRRVTAAAEEAVLMKGCFCVQGSVAPAGGEGVEQFASWVSGIRGDTFRPLFNSILDGHCMILMIC